MSVRKHFAVCVQNGEYEGTLDLRKIYEILDDPIASEKNYVRVVDESGEDYLYPGDWFLMLDLPETIEEALSHLASAG
jgi:hypothetical protein